MKAGCISEEQIIAGVFWGHAMTASQNRNRRLSMEGAR